MKPPMSQLEMRQYRALIEQYETYLERFWNDLTLHRLIPSARPMSIHQFYDSHRFDLPPTEAQIADFRFYLAKFYTAGQMLVSHWTPEMEMMLDRVKVDNCLTMSFDEWLEEFVSILPEHH